jgi:hypothetical protein
MVEDYDPTQDINWPKQVIWSNPLTVELGIKKNDKLKGCELELTVDFGSLDRLSITTKPKLISINIENIKEREEEKSDCVIGTVSYKYKISEYYQDERSIKEGIWQGQKSFDVVLPFGNVEQNYHPVHFGGRKCCDLFKIKMDVQCKNLTEKILQPVTWVYGPPGIGKTYLLEEWVKKLQDKEKFIPVHIVIDKKNYRDLTNWWRLLRLMDEQFVLALQNNAALKDDVVVGAWIEKFETEKDVYGFSSYPRLISIFKELNDHLRDLGISIIVILDGYYYFLNKISADSIYMNLFMLIDWTLRQRHYENNSWHYPVKMLITDAVSYDVRTSIESQTMARWKAYFSINYKDTYLINSLKFADRDFLPDKEAIQVLLKDFLGQRENLQTYQNMLSDFSQGHPAQIIELIRRARWLYLPKYYKEPEHNFMLSKKFALGLIDNYYMSGVITKAAGDAVKGLITHDCSSFDSWKIHKENKNRYKKPTMARIKDELTKKEIINSEGKLVWKLEGAKK